MKNNKLIILIAVSFLLLTDLCLVLQNSLYKKALRLLNNEVQISNYSQNAHAIMTINDSFINNGLSLQGVTVTDVYDNKSYLFQELFEGNNRDRRFLVCRFSEYDCEQCVDYAIQKAIESIKKSSLNVGLIILGNYEDSHVLKAYCSTIPGIGMAFAYNAPGKLLPIDENHNPFYFVTDNTLKVYDVFSPDKMDVSMTDAYFELLSKKVDNDIQE